MSSRVLLLFVCILVLGQTAGAQYVQQGPKLVGSGAVGFAYQGNSVALSADGNTALVGGPRDDSSTGAAWAYTRSGGVWNQQGPKLIGTGAVHVGVVRAQQGVSVALSADGNTALIGGNGDNNSVGAVWAFTRSGGVWNQQGSKLVPAGNSGPANFGDSLALSADGNTVVIGGADDNSDTGAAWIFTRSGGVWTQQGSKLVGTGTVNRAQQGYSVAISGDGNTVAVGGPIDDGAEFGGGVGAVWIFTRSGSTWTQQGSKLVGTGVERKSRQGYSVALSADGNTLISGGDADDLFRGAAWVFTRSGGVWRQQGSKLTDETVPRNATGSKIGHAVALSADGNTAIVTGEQDNNGVGATWVYARSGGVWRQQGPKLVGTGATGNAHQGLSAALSADASTLIVGGYFDNSLRGAAWVFSTSGGGGSAPPVISQGGVIHGASFRPGIAPGTWVTIAGSGLSGGTRIWSGADFTGNNLPTQLDDVRVTINGKPAYVYFISPTQLNVLSPADTAQGPVDVQVTTSQGSSNVTTAAMSSLAPGLFTFSAQSGRYAAAVRADGAFLGRANLIAGLTTIPAKPGDSILLFGTGFGSTTPARTIGQVTDSAPLAAPATVRIGGVTATVQFAGLVSPGLYQFNVVVPNVVNGDAGVTIETGISTTQPNVFLTVQR